MEVRSFEARNGKSFDWLLREHQPSPFELATERSVFDTWGGEIVRHSRKYNCAGLAFVGRRGWFGQEKPTPTGIVLEGAGGGLSLVFHEQVKDILAADGYRETRTPRAGDLALYGRDGEFQHVARVVDKGDGRTRSTIRVLSKFGGAVEGLHYLYDIPKPLKPWLGDLMGFWTIEG